MKLNKFVIGGLLIAAPVVAQSDPVEMPVPGTVVVMAGVYDGVDIIPVEQYIIVPPIAWAMTSSTSPSSESHIVRVLARGLHRRAP